VQANGTLEDDADPLQLKRLMAKKKSDSAKSSSAHLGFEAKLWLTADTLQNMDAAEYKHVALPKDYARPGLDKQRLGELIDVIATIELTAASEGG
jgi:LAS superfamily LD-carboxypeptidase LdcB